MGKARAERSLFPAAAIGIPILATARCGSGMPGRTSPSASRSPRTREGSGRGDGPGPRPGHHRLRRLGSTVQLWDVGTGEPIGEPLISRTANVNAATIKRGDVIALSSHYSAGSGSDSQTANIDAVAIGRAGGRDIVVSGSDNGIVRVWDAGTGEPIGEPLSGHFAEVNAVAIGRAGRWDVMVSGGGDQTVWIWGARTGKLTRWPVRRPSRRRVGSAAAHPLHGRAAGACSIKQAEATRPGD